MIFQTLLQNLRSGKADFEDVLAYISDHHEYRKVLFKNGIGDNPIINEAGQNEGSCRVFSLAKLKRLSEEDTLLLFGRHYRHVKSEPEGNDHANIRRFMKDGWAGIHFEQEALSIKED